MRLRQNRSLNIYGVICRARALPLPLGELTMRHLKKLKSVIFILSFLLIVVAIFLGLYAMQYCFISDADVFEANWKIVLPDGIKEKYAIKGPTDLQGHGSRYAVYKMTSSDAFSLLTGASWLKNAKIETAITDILDSIGVDKKEYPNFSGKYEWRILSYHNYRYKLYIVYDTNSSLLYLIQDMP
jgi:hypothetical protein